MQSTANLPVIGLDLAKSVFQLHIVDVETGEIQRRQIKRAKLTEFFAKCPPSLVAMEACGTAHHWARAIGALGHRVKLLPGQHVKAFLLRDKTDAMDAQAIWVAAQQPHIKPVPVKTERQQTCMALHGMRRQLMKIRIMQTNALRISVATGHSVRFLLDSGNGRTWTPGSALLDTRNLMQLGVDFAAPSCHVGWPGGCKAG